MIEATTNRAARAAFKKAHEERAKATAQMWSWLFGKSSR